MKRYIRNVLVVLVIVGLVLQAIRLVYERKLRAAHNELLVSEQLTAAVSFARVARLAREERCDKVVLKADNYMVIFLSSGLAEHKAPVIREQPGAMRLLREIDSYWRDFDLTKQFGRDKYEIWSGTETSLREVLGSQSQPSHSN